MNVGRRSARQLASQKTWASGPICNFCLRDLISRRSLATAAAAQAEPPSTSQIPNEAPPGLSPVPIRQINAGVVLSRPPQITRDLHPFEKAFFLYQRRLNERLALPFSRYFYFKQDTPADIEWKRKAKPRQTPARDIGVYNAYGEEGWNDELVVGAQESETMHQVEALLKDSEAPGVGAGSGAEGQVAAAPSEVMERPAPRVTEADAKGDVKNLNRLLQRTLYLLVKNKDDSWTFPQDLLLANESLHAAAERVLVFSGGLNMNTWVIGNAPVGRFSIEYRDPVNSTRPNPIQVNEEVKIQKLGEHTFFMKVRMLAGQADLAENKLGLQDFKWLAKEEIEKAVSPRYWSQVKNMLAER